MTGRWRHGSIRNPLEDGGQDPVILKLGGSLLGLRDWPRLLDAIIGDIGDRALSLVVGGGAIVDGLRAIDEAARQESRLMHDLAVDAMHLTARLVSKNTGLRISAKPSRTAGACILDVPVWLLDNNRSEQFPAGWDVTSDSIAARVADEYGASLLLAKPAPPPTTGRETSLESLADAGWVDRFFPMAAARLERIAWATPAG